MTVLWPQLPDAVARNEYERLRAGAEPIAVAEHAAQVWSPIGGRVKTTQIQALVDELTLLAERFGYPAPSAGDRRIAFDRASTQVLRNRMNLDWSEAGKRDLWSFLALVALPHLTRWRFGLDNRERWLASDLTRHTWARLWWQAVVFAGHETLLDALSESDLNQLLERRSIGGDPRLVCALAQAVLSAPTHTPRRVVIRDATLRLRRWLAFLDLRVVDDNQLDALCQHLIQQTVSYHHVPIPVEAR